MEKCEEIKQISPKFLEMKTFTNCTFFSVWHDRTQLHITRSSGVTLYEDKTVETGASSETAAASNKTDSGSATAAGEEEGEASGEAEEATPPASNPESSSNSKKKKSKVVKKYLDCTGSVAHGKAHLTSSKLTGCMNECFFSKLSQYVRICMAHTCPCSFKALRVFTRC